eukprot:m.192683 g.192683  ORF g.192683 m.192683 type:complete len:284 (+) comp53668_c0_seq2:361-1212(+)
MDGSGIPQDSVPALHAASALHSLASSSAGPQGHPQLMSTQLHTMPPQMMSQIPHIPQIAHSHMPMGQLGMTQLSNMPMQADDQGVPPGATTTSADVHGIDGSIGNQQPWMANFWQTALNIPTDTVKHYKDQILPLARVRKIMKLADDEVQMIAVETPILLAKATEAFIADLTVRAFSTEIENGMRRTLQKADIQKATSKSDMFDFLIDILPREAKTTAAPQSSLSNRAAPTTIPNAGATTTTDEDRENAHALALFQQQHPQVDAQGNDKPALQLPVGPDAQYN